MLPVRLLRTILVASACLAKPLAGQATDSLAVARRIVAAASLAAKEYALGVAPAGGKITRPEEVDEARLFVQQAQFDISALPATARADAGRGLARLGQMLQRLAPPDSMSRVTDSLVALITRAAGGPQVLEALPSTPPSLARGAVVFHERCAACHGESGKGDGPKAKSVKGPPPADLTDPTVMSGTTMLEIFRRVSIGVPGTSMPEFAEDLSEQDRWAVSAYVAAMQYGGSATAATFAAVRRQVDSALATGSDKVAFDAYLTFEQVETEVRARNAGLASDLESAFAWLRVRATRADANEKQVIRERLLAGLERAERAVADRPSSTNLFVASFFLLLREGFEAILIVAALMTFLAKAGAAERRREVARGAWLAVAASLLTWALVELLFQITPGQREAIEGGTMLLAAAVLFYVSYWLLSKIEAAKWTAFVKGKMQSALSSGSGIALSAVAFLAVYREGFETILFYNRRNRSRGGGLGHCLSRDQPARPAGGDEAVLRDHRHDALLHGVRLRGERNRGAAGSADRSTDHYRRGAAASGVRDLSDSGIAGDAGSAARARDRRGGVDAATQALTRGRGGDRSPSGEVTREAAAVPPACATRRAARPPRSSASRSSPAPA